MLDAMGGCRDQEHRNNTDLNTDREAMELSKKKKKRNQSYCCEVTVCHTEIGNSPVEIT